jgi:signal transduction histidine kinase
MRLRIAEEIRAVEGDVEQLPYKFDAIRNGDVVWYFTKEQLENLFEDSQLELTSKAPGGRTFIRISWLEHWRYLSFKDGFSPGDEASEESKRAIYLVGLGTLVSTIGLVYAAVWIGRRQLAEARSQTDLAASVAHELRPPLAGQRVVLESLLGREQFDKEYLQMALRENLRLGDLSEEFLTYSRLERGILELQLKSLSLMEVIEPMVDDFREQHGDGIFELSGDSSILALVDEAAVTTLVRNLIENGWKYSEEPKKVQIQIFETADEVGFFVKDEGVGLSPGDLKKVFRQFYRVERKLSRSQDGLGLGLSIAKRLVDAMEGRVEVESTLGKGSRFTVFLKRGGGE